MLHSPSRPCLAMRAAQYHAVLTSLQPLLTGDSDEIEHVRKHLSAVLSHYEVSNGDVPEASDVPQCAALLRDGAAPASAVFVSGKVMLTAAHAVQNIPVNLLHVSLPLANIGDSAPSYNVVDFRLAPIGDIAVLALKDAVSGVPSLRLAGTTDFNQPDLRDDGSGLKVCGFGKGFLPSAPSSILHGVKLAIQVPILPSSVVPPEIAFNSKYEFVAGDTDEYVAEIHNICLGDSGGPALSTKDPTLLIGIVDRGMNNRDNCGNFPRAFYARIDVHAPWIRDAASEMGVPLPPGL